MRQKWLLGVAAVAVAAMVVLLLVSVRGGGEGTASTGGSAAPSTGGTVASTPSQGGAAAAAPPPATPVAPEVRRPQPPPVPEDPGNEVRDHRGQGVKATPSPIAPQTIATVRKALVPAVRACGEALDIETQRVKFAAHAVLRAGGGRISAHDVRVTGAESLGPGFNDCVKRAYESLVADGAPEQTDGEDTVHMPWTVP